MRHLPVQITSDALPGVTIAGVVILEKNILIPKVPDPGVRWRAAATLQRTWTSQRRIVPSPKYDH
jgi:hypothetical protein